MKLATSLVNPTVLRGSLVAVAISAVVGCNSSNSDSLPISDIQVMPVTESKLTNASADQVALTLQNGLYLFATGNNAHCVDCQFMTLDGGIAESASDRGNHSTTTTQEQGVDESDRIKYDGDILYIASSKQGAINTFTENSEQQDVQPAQVRVLSRNADDSLSELAVIRPTKDAIDLSDLYLHQDVLTMIYNVDEPVEQSGSAGVSTAMILPFNNKLGLNFQNVEQAGSPQRLAEYEIDGSLVSSRRIDDKVYVVSRYNPSVPEGITIPEGKSEAELQKLYRELLATNVNQVLPKIKRQDGTTKPLVQAEDCYIPRQHSNNHGFTTITTVTTFDLDNPSDYTSSCVLAPLEGFYSSASNMYLYEKQYNETEKNHSTVIHKFGYQAQGIKYVATGSVPGHVSWNKSHLRFSEKDNYLRVVTSDMDLSSEEETRVHRLFVLKDNAQQDLEQIAQLPNEESPAKIGKPDEDIYAVRYFGDKAYVVTFRRTDPLYVIDLSTPTAPVIQGELEIPGYSGYLQPINESFVLGIGQQVDPDAVVGAPLENSPTDIIEGAKAELYDVSNPAAPRVAATLIYPKVNSVAEWDYRALTQLKVSDSSYRFAFPVAGWSESVTDNEAKEWTYQQSMQLVELDVSGQGELTSIGSLAPKSDFFGQWGDRAVLHNELVFYVRGNKVWQSYWDQPSLLNGPY